MPGLAAKSVDETRRRNEFSSNKPGLDNKHDQDAGGATDLLAQPYRRPGLRAGALVLIGEQKGRRRLCGYLVVGEPRQQRARIPRPFASMAVCGSDLPARDQAASRELPGHTNIVLAARKSAVLARRRVRRRTQGRHAAARGRLDDDLVEPGRLARAQRVQDRVGVNEDDRGRRAQATRGASVGGGCVGEESV